MRLKPLLSCGHRLFHNVVSIYNNHFHLITVTFNKLVDIDLEPTSPLLWKEAYGEITDNVLFLPHSFPERVKFYQYPLLGICFTAMRIKDFQIILYSCAFCLSMGFYTCR